MFFLFFIWTRIVLGLRVASCGLRVAGYELRVPSYGLRVTSYGLIVPRLIIFPSLQGISSTLRQSPVWMSFQLVLSKAAAMLCTFCTMSPPVLCKGGEVWLPFGLLKPFDRNHALYFLKLRITGQNRRLIS